MPDGYEPERIVRQNAGGADCSAGEEITIRKGCVALPQVRLQILHGLAGSGENLQRLLAVPLMRPELNPVAQAISDGDRGFHLPDILDVGFKRVAGDMVDQRCAKRLGDKVAIPHTNLGRTVHKPQHCAVHVGPTTAAGAASQAIRRESCRGATGRPLAGGDGEKASAVLGGLTDPVDGRVGQPAGYDVGAQVDQLPEVVGAAELDKVLAMNPA